MDIEPFMDEEDEDSDDSESSDESNEFIDDDGESEDGGESFEEKLIRHFPGVLYYHPKFEKAYDDATRKLPIVRELYMEDTDSLDVFGCKYDMRIGNKVTSFSAPFNCFHPKEYMYIACNVIDKILKYAAGLEEEEEEEEWPSYLSGPLPGNNSSGGD